MENQIILETLTELEFKEFSGGSWLSWGLGYLLRERACMAEDNEMSPWNVMGFK